MRGNSATRWEFVRAVGFALGLVAAAMMSSAAAVDVNAAGAGSMVAIAGGIAPSPLLSIDQNRTTVVDRIVTTWGDALAAAGAGLTKDQLRALLTGLRSDQLLAASLAGSLEGLRNVIANALTANASIATGLLHTKALGDIVDDLVYTPVTPCRIVDTRSGAGGTVLAGQTRNWLAANPAGTFAAQGGAATNCGIPIKPAAVMVNITVLNTGVGPAFMTAWPFNQAQPNASLINWLVANDQVANAVAVPLCTGGGCTSDFSVFTSAQANMVLDVLGYIAAPSTPTGTVTNVATGTGLSGGPITTTGTVSVATSYQMPQSCASGQVPKSNGAGMWTCAADNNSGGTVTAVTASAPLASSGGSAPNLSLTGIVPMASGGTGVSSSGAAGNVLRSTGAAWASAALQAGDIPSLAAGYIQNATSQQVANFNVNGTGTANDLNTVRQMTVDLNGTYNGSALTEFGGVAFGAFNSFEVIGSKRTAGGNQFGLDFFTNGVPRLSITNGGNVGVGTQAPGSLLTVAGPIESTSGGVKYPDGTVQTSASQAPVALVNTGGNILTTVDSASGVGQYTSITLGADGQPVVSYYDATNGYLKVAKCVNAACTGSSTITTVDSTGNVGEYTSITLGADGLPVISYYDITNTHLKVAKCVNAACTGPSTLTAVDSASGVGQYTSITLGADGLPVISYYDVTNTHLKVAKCVNAACTGSSTLTTVDTASGVGQDTSITLGEDGLPVISYYDSTNTHLKVAKCVNAACTGSSTLTTVDSASGVGQYTSITLGADGLPVVSYWDHPSIHLKVAKCVNAACTGSSTVTELNASAGFTSITLGADGLPVISYGGNPGLAVAKCVNAACTGSSTITTVDPASGVGKYTSFTLGGDGLPVISYYDQTNTHLKVAKCASPTCVAFVRRR